MKAKLLSFLWSLLLSLVAFLAPIHGLMIAIGALLFIDLCLGVACARKLGTPITSKELKKTVIKLFLYELGVLVGFLLDTYFIPMNLVVRAVALAIGMTEAKSVFENLKTLTGIDVWQLLKAKLLASSSANTKP